MSTPLHIAPVWYFTPFYAILRAVPDQQLGALAMAALAERLERRFVSGSRSTPEDMAALSDELARIEAELARRNDTTELHDRGSR
jgi:hypothetical protein